MENLAPVVLFVYARPRHTQRTIESLLNNALSKDTDIIIYSDEGKDDNDASSVNEVRSYVKQISGFKSIEIVERNTNYGLSRNIIEGVTEVLSGYDRAIVLEDDIITNAGFLSFMNQALNTYENVRDIWHVSGWNYPISSGGIGDAFLWRMMNCWGWATWRDRWKQFEKDANALISTFTNKDIKRFNLDGAYNFWDQVISNYRGDIDTWAVFWYATIFKNDGLSVNPTKTLCINIGLDGTGTNCKKIAGTDKYDLDGCDRYIYRFPSAIRENRRAVKRIKTIYKKRRKPMVIRAVNKIKEFGKGYMGVNR